MKPQSIRERRKGFVFDGSWKHSKYGRGIVFSRYPQLENYKTIPRDREAGEIGRDTLPDLYRRIVSLMVSTDAPG
jgi:hypothetical protein